MACANVARSTNTTCERENEMYAHNPAKTQIYIACAACDTRYGRASSWKVDPVPGEWFDLGECAETPANPCEDPAHEGQLVILGALEIPGVLHELIGESGFAEVAAIARLVKEGANLDAIAGYCAIKRALPKDATALENAIFGQYESTERFARDYAEDIYTFEDIEDPLDQYSTLAEYWEAELRHQYHFDDRSGYVYSYHYVHTN